MYFPTVQTNFDFADGLALRFAWLTFTHKVQPFEEAKHIIRTNRQEDLDIELNASIGSRNDQPFE